MIECNDVHDIGGGRNNTIDNNIVINSARGMSLDARGINWASYHCAPNGGMQQSLEKMPYQNELWVGRYPWLTNIVSDELCVPKYNSVQRNVFLCNGNPSIDSTAAATVTVAHNWVTNKDLRFEDAANGDLNLRADSPVCTEVPGFESLPFDRMRKSTKPSFVPPAPLGIGLDDWGGKPNPSTEQVRSGTASHAVVADREYLAHLTAGPQENGTVTLWFFDDAAETSMQVSGNASMKGEIRHIGVSATASTTYYGLPSGPVGLW